MPLCFCSVKSLNTIHAGETTCCNSKQNLLLIQDGGNYSFCPCKNRCPCLEIPENVSSASEIFTVRELIRHKLPLPVQFNLELEIFSKGKVSSFLRETFHPFALAKIPDIIPLRI